MKGASGLAVLTVVQMLLIACAPRGEVSHDSDREAIAAMYAERSNALQVGANLEDILKAYLAVVSEDATWMPQNAPPLVGKPAVESWARQFFTRYSLDVDSIPMDVLDVGRDLAVRRFRSVGRYIPADGSDPVPYDQKYVDYLRKTPNGNWQLVLHMWSSNNTEPTIWDDGS
jgi:ketosteroid isomerase-like protein